MTIKEFTRRKRVMERDSIFEAEQLLFELENSTAPKEQIVRLQEIFAPLFEKEREREYKEQLEIEKYSWANFLPHRNLQTVIQTLSSIITFHQEAKLEEDRYNDATQDLLHAFELTNPSDDDLIELGREVIKLRQQRRKTKNFLEVTEPLFNFAVKNRNILKELGQIQSEMNRKLQTLDNRSYQVKEKTALQEAFDKVKKETA